MSRRYTKDSPKGRHLRLSAVRKPNKGGNLAAWRRRVAECKNRWAAIRDTFPEPSGKQKSGEVPYTQSIYDADSVNLMGIASTEKTSSHLMPLENSTWSADYSNFPDQGTSDQEPNINFPEIKVEVDSFDEEDKTDGNSDFGFIVPNSVCEVVTDTQPSVFQKRTFSESDEDVISAKSKKLRELSSSESVAVTETEHKPPEHPIETFFKSMAATVLTFPPHLMAIAKLNVCKLITELELRALTEKEPYDGESR